ncbi:MAG: hypothetical protein IJT91_08245 [Clostridia bacterium]|nr:hypothetical protein [Clostridia bacterium]
MILIVSVYAAVSVLLYIAVRLICRKTAVFRAPSSRAMFYILSLTWGSPMVIFGGAVAAVLFIAGHRPVRFGWEWCFELPDIKWGLELGLFFIAPGNDIRTKIHEHGHGLQNIYFGIFTVPVIFIPSAIRFWYREIREKLNKPCRNDYDDIWFERSATESGKALIERLGKDKTL